MNKKLLWAIIFLLSTAAIANAQFANNSVEISGAIEKEIISRGKPTKATVILKIPDGLHTNSHLPTGEFALPTTLKVSSDSGISIGKVIYPPGRNVKFAFADEPLNVYEGRAKFNFTVFVPKNFRKKKLEIFAVVDYQACTNEVCFPPKKQKIVLTAKVK